MSTKPKIFKNKTTENLYEEIYNSYNDNDLEIKKILNQLAKVISDSTSHGEGATVASVITPMISQLLNNKIRNSALLVELAKIAQKTEANEKELESIELPTEELKQLLNSFKEN